MMSIVRRRPFFDGPTHVDVGGQPVLVRPFQLVVWVSYPRGNPLAPRLPLLGLRAMAQNNLETVIDGERRELTIRRKRRLFRGW